MTEKPEALCECGLLLDFVEFPALWVEGEIPGEEVDPAYDLREYFPAVCHINFINSKVFSTQMRLDEPRNSRIQNRRDGPALPLNDVFMKNKLSTLEVGFRQAVRNGARHQLERRAIFPGSRLSGVNRLEFRVDPGRHFPTHARLRTRSVSACQSPPSKSIVTLMLHNHNLQINKTDSYGINAFWIAACKGHVPVSLATNST